MPCELGLEFYRSPAGKLKLCDLEVDPSDQCPWRQGRFLRENSQLACKHEFQTCLENCLFMSLGKLLIQFLENFFLVSCG